MGTQIDQDIPELPIPPYKNVDSGATFVAKAEAFRQALKDTFQPAMNYVIGKMNIISDEVSTNATNAETAASIAAAAANYKGDWIAGYNTTGYSVGMSVTFTDGFNYISKINNNLVSPTSKTNTTQWGWIEKYENLDGYDAKTTPVNADLLPLSDSTTNFSVKKLTWSNIKNTIINSFYSMISGLSSKTTVGVLDEFVINDSGASTKKVTYQNLINTIATSFGGMINTLTAKTTPVDADIFPIADSVDSNATKKITWAKIKATIISSFGAMIATLTSKTTPVDDDIFPIGDSASSNATKKLSWANIKATLKTYFDAYYLNFVVNDSRVKIALNALGTAPIYACRAKINFNQVTNVINESVNISSIADLGVGFTRVNVVSAMPTDKYTISALSATPLGISGTWVTVGVQGNGIVTTTSFTLQVLYATSNDVDADYVAASII